MRPWHGPASRTAYPLHAFPLAMTSVACVLVILIHCSVMFIRGVPVATSTHVQVEEGQRAAAEAQRRRVGTPSPRWSSEGTSAAVDETTQQQQRTDS